ncbi:MAG: polyprenyl synthetase family protein [Candidatus Bathyarchaeota archaeon]|jgi:geranylgeranyl diphosphate synthase type I
MSGEKDRTLNEEIFLKLKSNAENVDKYIYNLLEPRKPVTLYEASKHTFKAGGKRLRPYLVMKVCELVGGDPEDALPFAAAMEILHNFTLVHDDIMDNDTIRRGSPTVHVKWGAPIAIASGDLLFAKVYEAMYALHKEGTLPCERVIECIRRVTDATIAICEGQVLDVSYPDTAEVSEEDYVLMVGSKTSALFKACAEVGAIAGGADQCQVEKLGSFAWDAGIAFQIVDDILGALADEEELGKPVGSDLREGKKTLIIIHALGKAPPRERAAILKVLGDEGADPEDLEVATNALLVTGAIDYAKEKAREYSIRAKEILSSFPDSQAKEDLLKMVDYFMSRSY